MKPLTPSPVPNEGEALLPRSAITRIDEGKRDKEVITPMRQDAQGAQEGLSTVRCGNALADGARHHGWFIGRFLEIQFPGMECVLSEEGDYALWSAGVPHRWAVVQESLVLTVRWPSAPEAYREQVEG